MCGNSHFHKYSGLGVTKSSAIDEEHKKDLQGNSEKVDSTIEEDEQGSIDKEPFHPIVEHGLKIKQNTQNEENTVEYGEAFETENWKLTRKTASIDQGNQSTSALSEQRDIHEGGRASVW